MIEALTELVNWIQSGIYDFFVSAFAYVIAGISLVSGYITLSTLSFFWDVAKSLLELLSIQTMLQGFLSQLNSEAVSFVAYLRGFDALMLVLNAKVTKYIMNIMGV